jgi:predicted aspartyl protease
MRSEIPFRVVGGDQPLLVVSARFNGSDPLDCVLDTGASHAMLLPEVAARLGVRVEETRQAQGAGGPVEVWIGTADTIALGDAVVRSVPLLMSPDLERIGRAVGARIDGNIGHGFLRHFRVTVDYERQSLTLCSPDEPADSRPARAELPFRLAHPAKPLIVLPVKANGHDFQFALDTGASITVISPEAARRCGVEGVAMPSMTGGGGAVPSAAGTLKSLAIDRVSISRVRVAIADFVGMLARVTGAPMDGIIGTNVLRRFRVTIDYPAERLVLE